MSKLPKVGTTIFTVMSALAKEYNAINLSQGFPDFAIDQVLIDKLRETAGGDYHQYMPMPGFPKLRIAVAGAIAKTYKRLLDPETELLITAGATQAIFTTLMALVSNEEEVIILDPSYDCYAPGVVLSGGIPIHVPLNEDYSVNWNRIEKAISSKTRMLIINNPHNPSGRTWTEKDFMHLEQLMTDYPQLLLLSDEVYEYITFEEKHRSVNHYPKLTDRTIIVSSFGKTFHITGWKLGYLVADEPLMTEIKKVHQFNVFSVNSVAQATIASYMSEIDLSGLGTFYMEKRDLFRGLLAESRFRLLPCEGTYFQVVDYSAISSEPDVEFCKRLTIDYGVAAIPISVFNADGRDEKKIRFCFAKKEETLINAAQKLCRI